MAAAPTSRSAVLRELWRGEVLSFDGEFDSIDRGVVIPGPRRQIPIWVGGFSRRAFERGVTLGDGFIFAGDERRVHGALANLRAGRRRARARCSMASGSTTSR